MALSLGAVAALTGGPSRRRLVLLRRWPRWPSSTKQTFNRCRSGGGHLAVAADRPGRAVRRDGPALALGVWARCTRRPAPSSPTPWREPPTVQHGGAPRRTWPCAAGAGGSRLWPGYLLRRGRAGPGRPGCGSRLLGGGGAPRRAGEGRLQLQLRDRVAAVASVLATHGLWLDRPDPGDGLAGPAGRARSCPGSTLPPSSWSGSRLAWSPALWPPTAPADELRRSSSASGPSRGRPRGAPRRGRARRPAGPARALRL